MKKLSPMCFIFRSIRDNVHLEVLQLVYFGLVQFALQYGIIFWGSSAYTGKVFIIQGKSSGFNVPDVQYSSKLITQLLLFSVTIFLSVYCT